MSETATRADKREWVRPWGVEPPGPDASTGSPGPVLLFGGEGGELGATLDAARRLGRALAAAGEQPSCWFWSPAGRVFEVALDAVLGGPAPFERELLYGRAASWRTLADALGHADREARVVLLVLRCAR